MERWLKTSPTQDSSGSAPGYTPQGAKTEEPREIDKQLEFFRECLAVARTPREKKVVNLPGVIREWHPPTTPSYPPAEIQKRHPAFQWGWDDVPVIKIPQAVRGERRGRFGKFPSRKMQRSVRARSVLEYDFIRWLEFDADVEAYIERPVILRYRDGRRSRVYAPDFFVRRADSPGAFIEVALEAAAALPKAKTRQDAIGRAVAALGYSYSVLTERHIRAEPAFSTLKTLFLRNAWTPLPDAENCSALQRLLADGPLSLNAIVQSVPDISDGQLRALALRGFLKLDLSRPLTEDSLVTLSGRSAIRYRGPIE